MGVACGMLVFLNGGMIFYWLRSAMHGQKWTNSGLAVFSFAAMLATASFNAALTADSENIGLLFIIGLFGSLLNLLELLEGDPEWSEG